eukprot:1053989-Amphidinium_carterae.1
MCAAKCVERFIEFVSEQAYVEMALQGTGFIRSAQKALAIAVTRPVLFAMSGSPLLSCSRKAIAKSQASLYIIPVMVQHWCFTPSDADIHLLGLLKVHGIQIVWASSSLDLPHLAVVLFGFR